MLVVVIELLWLLLPPCLATKSIRNFFTLLAGQDTREGLKKSILDFFRRAESGTGPDSALLDQALACSIRERAIRGARNL
ncbi:MAG: hypothetical protein DYH17_06770 [Xanthomonadales bacterium PRO6]|nr:hypothetical protein [Xanthomonadales bacterium PRO6]